MILYLFFCILLVNLSRNEEFSADYIGDIDHFDVIYNLYSESVESQLQQLLKDEPNRIYSMKTVDQEDYQCVLPVIERMTHKKISEYSGPSPADLIKPLSDLKVTSIFGGNGYWLYDFAHGRYISQYHENREQKEKTEYSLGTYRADQAEEEAKKFDQLHPPKTKIRDVEYPYYPVKYRHGTACDLTNKPRETTVMYVCYEFAQHMIHSITEVSTCNYELIVLTNLLCSHPAFQSPMTPEHQINCYAAKNAQVATPIKQREYEKQALAENSEQFSMLLGSTNPLPGTKSSVFSKILSSEKNPTQKAHITIKLDDVDSEGGVNELLKNEIKEMLDLYLKSKDINSLLPTLRRLERELTDEDLQLMDDFWSGKSCFVGGTGFWRYELCYNNKVTQFHLEGHRRTKEIVLGEYDEEEHRKWYQKNKDKVLIMEKDVVQQVSNFYSNGDFCEETGERRSVEVKLKCRVPKSEEPISLVLLSLEEPSTCKYVLKLESVLLCEGLQLLDNDGLVDETTAEHDHNSKKKEQQDSEVKDKKD